MKLVIFTTCKPFVGDDSWRQEQAIRSWTLLEGMEIKIIIIGNDNGTKEISEKYKLIHEPIVRNLQGRPYLYSMFEIANKYANDEDVLLWTNSDMIYFNCLINSIKFIKSSNSIKDYCLVGARHDWLNPSILKTLTGDSFLANMELLQTQHGQAKISHTESDKYVVTKHAPTGIDYAIHSKTTFINRFNKNLVIGGWTHDMKLLGCAIKYNIFTCDISEANFCIHQNHDYIHSAKQNSNNIYWKNNNTNANSADIMKGITDTRYLIKKEGTSYIQRAR